MRHASSDPDLVVLQAPLSQSLQPSGHRAVTETRPQVRQCLHPDVCCLALRKRCCAPDWTGLQWAPARSPPPLQQLRAHAQHGPVLSHRRIERLPEQYTLTESLRQHWVCADSCMPSGPPSHARQCHPGGSHSRRAVCRHGQLQLALAQ